MSIYTKPINAIEYDDVVSFCQQKIAEGVNLDYKKDFPPSGLEKTISAFANTFGGVIIIGVGDEDSKPKPPFIGIDYKDRLEERVWNIILDNIYPPVFPEIRVCTVKNKKTFIVIRVPQSNETPHAIRNKTEVYIRTGNRNKPEDLATIDQIEWLMSRRKKSEELKITLYSRAEEHYQNICKSKDVKIEFGEFTLSFIPLYPQKPLITNDEIETVAREMRVIDNENREFPWIPASLKPMQDGMVSFFFNERTRFINHTEINKFGLIYYKEDVGSLETKESTEEQQKKMDMDRIVRILDVSFDAIGKFYQKVGYWGLVEIKFSINRVLGVKFIPLVSKNAFFLDDRGNMVNEVEQSLAWQMVTSVPELNDTVGRQKQLIKLGKDIAWSFGFKVNEEKIIEKFRERRRWVEENAGST